MKKRILITIVGLMLILCGMVQYAKSQSETECIEYTVSEGDTLWGIAYEKYGDSADVRECVYAIECINDIEDHIICEGDTIYLPNRVSTWKLK